MGWQRSMVSSDDEVWFSAPTAAPLDGSEPFRGIDDAQVLDFWRFAMSGVRMNNVRGYFPEFRATILMNDVRLRMPQV